MALYSGADSTTLVRITLGVAGGKLGITMAYGVQDQMKKVVATAQVKPVLFDGTPSLWSLKV